MKKSKKRRIKNEKLRHTLLSFLDFMNCRTDKKYHDPKPNNEIVNLFLERNKHNIIDPDKFAPQDTSIDIIK